MRIKTIKKTESDFVYNLEIKDNNNFIANNILVHNCIRSLMKKLGKKEQDPKDLKKWEEAVNKFKVGAGKKGISAEQVEFIANDLLAMSQYSFNKCISGKNYIKINNNKLSIEKMFLAKNDNEWAKKNNHKNLHSKYINYGYPKSYSLKNDRLFPNKIKDIYFRGTRETFKITLENGFNIDVTSNHKFPLEGGIEKSIESGLKIGDNLYINNNQLLTKLIKIVSIKSNGLENVYDIEMEHPYHTLVVNNIVTSNSHSVCYSYIAVMTLYMSYYFKKYYYSAVLSYEADRKEYLLDRLNSVKLNNFKILPPNINKSDVHFNTTDNGIIFGLSDIKYVGEEPAKMIISKRPYKSFLDFLFKTRDRTVNSRLIKALISVGAFDDFDKERTKLLYTFERFWEEKKSIKIEEKLEALFYKIYNIDLPGMDTTLEKKMSYEKEYIGFAFFNTLFTNDKIELFLKMSKRDLIKMSVEEVKGDGNIVPVIINSCRELKDKNKNDMAFINITDYFGKTYSIPIFQNYWKYVKEKIELEKINLVSIYRDDKNKYLFGKRYREENIFRIKQMVRKV